MNAQDKNEEETLAGDLLKGVREISGEIGDTPRRTYHLLETNQIPAGKIGGIWHASRRKLRKRYDQVTGGASE